MRVTGDTWGWMRLAAFVCLPALFPFAGAAQKNEAAEFQARFDHETDPVQKAKLMQRLGMDQFSEIRKEIDQGNLAEATGILDQYRDDARICIEGLDAKKINAAKHSSGFKQLQISVQEALRQMDEIVAGLTGDQQTEFIAVRGDLQKMNDHLVEELFPSSPAPKPPEEKSDH
ncbi:MAG TPA: hypothetical protein VMD78_09365 [Candidatus Baltobacteraceae bacterium]|nr:hypothetical protein [Candidatus Baltobacteraceae bacterium]